MIKTKSNAHYIKILQSVSVSAETAESFALIAFGDNKISISYNCLLYIPYRSLDTLD